MLTPLLIIIAKQEQNDIAKLITENKNLHFGQCDSQSYIIHIKIKKKLNVKRKNS